VRGLHVQTHGRWRVHFQVHQFRAFYLCTFGLN